MLCDHELASEWARCSAKNASKITMELEVRQCSEFFRCLRVCGYLSVVRCSRTHGIKSRIIMNWLLPPRRTLVKTGDGKVSLTVKIGKTREGCVRDG